MGWGWGDLANAIPGVNILYNAGASGYDYATGDTAGGNQHAKNLAGDALTAGWYGTGQEAVKAGKAGWSALKNAYDAPFEEKRAAYDRVGQMSQEIQQKRIQRQQDILRQTLAARDPERNAINAVYGDPKNWKL